MVKFWNPAKSYLARNGTIPEAWLMYGVPEDLLAIDLVASEGQLILRNAVDIFEEKLATYVGTKYAVAVASGTDALILSLKAAGIQPGDEVIVPSYTFRATIEAVHHAGGVPVLADLGDDWRKYKTSKTRFIIPAHMAGEVMDWNTDEDEEIKMIEDACQAIGAAPIQGLTACYSFYPAKILGCLGDGGAIATNDVHIYNELKYLRNHRKGDWGKGYGYNSRLDNIQAAVLLERIKYLPKWIARRKQIAEMYDLHLANCVKTPFKREVYQDYIIETSPFTVPILHQFLTGEGIETMLNTYPFPDETPKGPKASSYEASTLRLPCNPDLTDEEVMTVIRRIKNYFS